MDAKAVRRVGIAGSPAAEVLRLAKLAQRAGLDGVVTSTHEVKKLRKTFGEDFVLVVGGVRPRPKGGKRPSDDQARVATPAKLFARVRIISLWDGQSTRLPIRWRLQKRSSRKYRKSERALESTISLMQLQLSSVFPTYRSVSAISKFGLANQSQRFASPSVVDTIGAFLWRR